MCSVVPGALVSDSKQTLAYPETLFLLAMVRIYQLGLPALVVVAAHEDGPDLGLLHLHLLDVIRRQRRAPQPRAPRPWVL